MKLAMVSAGLTRQGAGVTAAVEALSRSVSEAGFNVRVFGYDCREWRDRDREAWRGAPTTVLPVLGPQVLGYSPRLRVTLDSWNPDLTHVHGLWLLNSRSVGQWALGSGRPLIISPHGMLAPSALRYSRLKKLLASLLYQSRAFARATCIHATSEEEYRDIRSYGLRQAVSIVPHGIDLPIFDMASEKLPVVLSLGRLHPIKGLDKLIMAWSLIERDFPSWRLEIFGPDSGGHRQELVALTKRLGLRNVHLCEPVFGEAKFSAMRRSGIFVLPSLSENFGVTVAESLACGTPVISTKGAPWSRIEEHRCGWWIDHGPEPMAEALKQAISLSSEERRAMGERGRAWMAQEFRWANIGLKMNDVYRWLINGGSPPPCVRVD